MVVLDLGRFYECTESARAAIGSRLLEIGVTALYIFSQKLRSPFRLAEILHCVINVVGQVALGLAKILDLRGLAFDARS